MRSVYAILILLLALVMSAQCQQTAEEWYNKAEDLSNQVESDEVIAARFGKGNAFAIPL
jgi:hypothetical protein